MIWVCFHFKLFNKFFKRLLSESLCSRMIPGFWEFQNCKNRPNRSMGSEDSSCDTGLSSNRKFEKKSRTLFVAMSAMAAMAAEVMPVSEKLSSLPVLRFGWFLQFWNSHDLRTNMEQSNIEEKPKWVFLLLILKEKCKKLVLVSVWILKSNLAPNLNSTSLESSQIGKYFSLVIMYKVMNYECLCEC